MVHHMHGPMSRVYIYTAVVDLVRLYILLLNRVCVRAHRYQVHVLLLVLIVPLVPVLGSSSSRSTAVD